jgi:hypothetical protein
VKQNLNTQLPPRSSHLRLTIPRFQVRFSASFSTRALVALPIKP